MSIISEKDLSNFKKDFESVPSNQVLARVVQKNGVNNSSINNTAKSKHSPIFSVDLKTGKVTNQKQSGRCWIFATLNTLRMRVAEKIKVKDFEFSQNYLSFYDRLEKANKFYDSIQETANKELSDRYVQEILHWGDDDGGQWANAAALINKYGVVPKNIMPETFDSEKTVNINAILNWKLKKDALELRDLVNNGANSQDIETYKKDKLSEVYRMLVFSFGQPPIKFNFEYRDDDNNYHIDKNLTPQEFYNNYVGVNFNDYVCLVDAPDHQVGKVYGLPSQDYIENGQKIKFVNVTTQDLKDATIKQLKAGEPVWFACDVLEDSDRKEGILDPDYFKQSDLFDLNLEFSKAQRLATGQGEVSHAMTLTGVDLIDNKPIKWKVENSWGDKNGNKGYFLMSDEWFDEYNYEVVINKKYLTSAQLEQSKQEKIDLEPWDSLR